MVTVGLPEDDEQLIIESHVFIDAKSGFYTFSNRTQDMTAEELFVKHAPPD